MNKSQQSHWLIKMLNAQVGERDLKGKNSKNTDYNQN